MLIDGIIPRVLGTHLSSVSRSKGHDFGGTLAYITRERLRGRHETFDFRDSDVLSVHAAGWPMSSDPDQRLLYLQRLVDEIQAVDRRSNSREGNTLVFELPYFEREASDPALREMMEGERSGLSQWLTDTVHRHTEAAVLTGRHAPPAGGSPAQHHGHAGVSRRVVVDGHLTDLDVETFKSKFAARVLLLEIREGLCARYNELARCYGSLKRWSPLDYPELFRGINLDRAARGLELLDVPTATRHEGAAVVAARRRKVKGERIEIENPVAEENERIRASNRAIAARNQERMSRDHVILTSVANREVPLIEPLMPTPDHHFAVDARVAALSPRLRGFDVVLDLRDEERARAGMPFVNLYQDRLQAAQAAHGNIAELRRALLDLPNALMRHLAAQHRSAEHLIREHVRASYKGSDERALHYQELTGMEPPAEWVKASAAGRKLSDRFTL